MGKDKYVQCAYCWNNTYTLNIKVDMCNSCMKEGADTVENVPSNFKDM